MKRSVRAWLALCLMLTMLMSALPTVVQTAAASALEYKVETVQYAKGAVIAKGSKIAVDVMINAQAGITMTELKLRYNKTELKPVSAKSKGVLSKFDFYDVNTAPLKPAIGATHATLGEIWITGMDLDAHATAANHVIATVEFQTLKELKDSSPIYAYGVPLAADASYNQMKGVCKNGGIRFADPAAATVTRPTAADGTVYSGVSMMPANESGFQHSSNGTVGAAVVQREGQRFRVRSDAGTPYVYYTKPAKEFQCSENDELYLNYNLQVVKGSANISVYFGGQSPTATAAKGSFVSVNGLVNASYVNASTGQATVNLPVGTYKGSVPIRSLGYRSDLKDANGNMRFSGCKIVTVGASEIVITALEIGPKPLKPWREQYATTTAKYQKVTPVTPSTFTVLPWAASGFSYVASGNGGTTKAVAYGSGYKLTSDKGWPYAYYDKTAQAYWCPKSKNVYLKYDIEVVKGTSIAKVYFGGVDPSATEQPGTFVSINGLVDSSYVNAETGAIRKELPVGRYTGSVPLSEIACREDLMDDKGRIQISGCRLYAVGTGSEVIVHSLGIDATGAYLETVDGENTLAYTVDAKGTSATIVGYSKLKPAVRIPHEINGIPVKAIADNAFRNCTALYAVEIPEAVTSIGKNAFAGCTKLDTVKYRSSEAKWKAVSKGENAIPSGVYVLYNVAAFKGYPDLPANAWYYEAAEHVTAKSYISGFKSGEFGGTANMTRQDFVLIISRIAKADLTPYADSNGGLTDVVKGSYYAPAVAWAVDNGIITGYKNGRFGVNNPITREQVCTIMYRFVGSPKVYNKTVTMAEFPDKATVSAYASDAMVWAVQNGVMSGMANGKIAPLSNASRAQVATILMRMGIIGVL